MTRSVSLLMRPFALAFILLSSSFVAPTIVAAQPAEKTIARLSGYIRDKANNELVRYALISVDGDSARSQSDVDGFYYLNLDAGTHRLQVRALGFAPLDTQVTLTDATTRDFFLVRNAQLARINISAAREKSEIRQTLPAR